MYATVSKYPALLSRDLSEASVVTSRKPIVIKDTNIYTMFTRTQKNKIRSKTKD